MLSFCAIYVTPVARFILYMCRIDCALFVKVKVHHRTCVSASKCNIFGVKRKSVLQLSDLRAVFTIEQLLFCTGSLVENRRAQHSDLRGGLSEYSVEPTHDDEGI